MEINESPLLRTGLESSIIEIEKDLGFDIHIAACDLLTSDIFQYRSDERCKTASVIKLPILVHAALLVEEGKLSWDEQLELRQDEKVAGSGVLTRLTAGLKLSIRDVCTLMTIISDNTGTNMMIVRLGTEPINNRMRQLGLLKTTCFRKAYTEDTEASKPYGLGAATAGEMIVLLNLIASRKLGSAETSANIEEILGGQIYRDCIPRLLPEEWKYAGKTGAVDGVRNDVGIITRADGRRFSLAVFCQNVSDLRWTADNEGLLAIANISKLLLLG